MSLARVGEAPATQRCKFVEPILDDVQVNRIMDTADGDKAFSARLRKPFALLA